jgi:hypothetical protein
MLNAALLDKLLFQFVNPIVRSISALDIQQMG